MSRRYCRLMGDRYERTTAHLRSTALAMLRDRGTRAFSIEALTKSADVGIGTIYERWDNRTEIVEDVIEILVLGRLRRFADSSSSLEFSERLKVLFDQDDGRETLALASEVLFARRDFPQLEDSACKAVESIGKLMNDDTLAPAGSSVNWWLTSLAVGWGILRTGDTVVPNIADDLMFVLTGEGSRCMGNPRDKSGEVMRPNLDGRGHDDDIADAIVEVAREMLSSEDVPPFSAREIGRRAGVSKGALYRRYGSKSDVIRKVLLTDLDEQRFEWSNELLDVLDGDDPVNDAANAMARTLRRVYEDEPMMRRLLEVTVAARTDETVRSHVVGHIQLAVEERFEIIGNLQEAGVLSGAASPESLSWFIQAVPIGTRLMASVGFVPEFSMVVEAFRSILENCVEESLASGS